jgi:hypothetical protein
MSFNLYGSKKLHFTDIWEDRCVYSCPWVFQFYLGSYFHQFRTKGSLDLEFRRLLGFHDLAG